MRNLVAKVEQEFCKYSLQVCSISTCHTVLHKLFLICTEVKMFMALSFGHLECRSSQVSL